MKKRYWMLAGGVCLVVLVLIVCFGLPEPPEQIPLDSPIPGIPEGDIAADEKNSTLRPKVRPDAAMPLDESDDTVLATTLDPNSEEMPPDDEPFDDAQAELELARTEMFKAEAMDLLPLLTLHTADPLRPDRPGPKRGEIWIRIQANRAGETRDIMAQVADLYRTTLSHEEPVTVMLWIGGQPAFRMEY